MFFEACQKQFFRPVNQGNSLPFDKESSLVRVDPMLNSMHELMRKALNKFAVLHCCIAVFFFFDFNA